MEPIIVTGLVSIVASVFGLVGVVIGGKIAASSAERAARAAERHHFRELGMKFALINFETCVKMAERASDSHGRDYKVQPLKSFVIQGLKIMEIISDPSLNSKAMAKKIAECEDFAAAIADAANKKYENKEANKTVVDNRH